MANPPLQICLSQGDLADPNRLVPFDELAALKLLAAIDAAHPNAIEKYRLQKWHTTLARNPHALKLYDPSAPNSDS